jgi:hypothetical protein
MNKILVFVLIGTAFWTSCTNTKSSSDSIEPALSQEIINTVMVTNFTWQEQVSGIEGVKN